MTTAVHSMTHFSVKSCRMYEQDDQRLCSLLVAETASGPHMRTDDGMYISAKRVCTFTCVCQSASILLMERHGELSK